MLPERKLFTYDTLPKSVQIARQEAPGRLADVG
jgi:hypothetical protein